MMAMTAVIVLLAGVYFLVLQPAAGLIRSQVEKLAASDTRHRLLAEMLSEARDTLELRVAERTKELLAANVALEREMTERQGVEMRMRELSADLAHASRVTALGQLATGLAHEINQPLATVANHAGTLELMLRRTRPADEGTAAACRSNQAGGAARRGHRASDAQLRAPRRRASIARRPQ